MIDWSRACVRIVLYATSAVEYRCGVRSCSEGAGGGDPARLSARWRWPSKTRRLAKRGRCRARGLGLAPGSARLRAVDVLGGRLLHARDRVERRHGRTRVDRRDDRARESVDVVRLEALARVVQQRGVGQAQEGAVVGDRRGVGEADVDGGDGGLATTGDLANADGGARIVAHHLGLLEELGAAGRRGDPDDGALREGRTPRCSSGEV
eukprot:4374951-Prymnesium_polylepis.1